MGELFADNYEIITSVAAAIVSFVTLQIGRFFKNKFASKILVGFGAKAKEELGEENYNELVAIGKEYGIKKLKEIVSKVLSEHEDLKVNYTEIKDLLKVLIENQIRLGVYEDNPELESQVRERL
jgi:hypothetical protein